MALRFGVEDVTDDVLCGVEVDKRPPEREGLMDAREVNETTGLPVV